MVLGHCDHNLAQRVIQSAAPHLARHDAGGRRVKDIGSECRPDQVRPFGYRVGDISDCDDPFNSLIIAGYHNAAYPVLAQ
jgi:hypothetical protein